MAKKSEKTEFTKGDLVRLKSGGPTMVVEDTELYGRVAQALPYTFGLPNHYRSHGGWPRLWRVGHALLLTSDPSNPHRRRG